MSFEVAIDCLKNYKKGLIARKDFIEKEIASGSTSSYMNELTELKRQIGEIRKAILNLYDTKDL